MTRAIHSIATVLILTACGSSGGVPSAQSRSSADEAVSSLPTSPARPEPHFEKPECQDVTARLRTFRDDSNLYFSEEAEACLTSALLNPFVEPATSTKTAEAATEERRIHAIRGLEFLRTATAIRTLEEAKGRGFSRVVLDAIDQSLEVISKGWGYQ